MNQKSMHTNVGGERHGGGMYGREARRGEEIRGVGRGGDPRRATSLSFLIIAHTHRASRIRMFPSAPYMQMYSGWWWPPCDERQGWREGVGDGWGRGGGWVGDGWGRGGGGGDGWGLGGLLRCKADRKLLLQKVLITRFVSFTALPLSYRTTLHINIYRACTYKKKVCQVRELTLKPSPRY